MNDIKQFDPDLVADALAGNATRRAVVRSAAWSLPVVAVAMAAPAMAASPPICGTCPPTGNQCILSFGGGGDCKCGPGLVCVGTGPLGLANMCVGTSILISTCGTATCYGVCAASNGVLIAAFNTLTNAMAAAFSLLPICSRHDFEVIPWPTNICISPLSGTIGSLCLITDGDGFIGGVIGPLINTFAATLSSLNLAVSNPCPSGMACTTSQGGFSADFGGGALCFNQGFKGVLGTCQCI